ncbi:MULTISPECIES: hypothetical protein [Bacillus]|uniref:hypothetical protein n=1 Tax=Bacillus TaxID=1386 RepID=UPI000B5DB66C|nr:MULTISPECIES: hypothetical protein [Bacillus]OXB98929.1 hypothetical protein CGQ22_10180 [Bacillus sp. M13(2017)]QCY64192.1 hypothetical protein FHE73_26890 [Bacillus thuringiensis]
MEQLTKLEKAIVIGTILNAIGEEKLEEYIELEKIEPLIETFDDMQENTTPKEKKEATTNLINKLIEDFLKEINQEEMKQSPLLKK